ncbi:unnamed protein product [Caenorhabditis auriculariae]|uniref:Cytidyltransferase-like domain-containing protein n=1 Tax=Caenorhabditis auriculariae TaxID=2777116 RepID=A0A8S1GN29_9PELO|nr:unnamed protein product [Caenorhabditis auriculariae]
MPPISMSGEKIEEVNSSWASDENWLMMAKRVAILAVGSFNPPTIMHLRMLEVARSYLEARNVSVLEGILSPVADQFNKPSLIPSVHRLAMAEAAVRSSDWIRADGWECRRTCWTRTLDVLRHHSHEIKKKHGEDVKMMLVVGGDVVESFPCVLPDGSTLWKPDDVRRIFSGRSSQINGKVEAANRKDCDTQG